MNQQAFIIFSGFNQRAVIAFIRMLERRSVSYFIISSGVEDSIRHTPYARNVVVTRSTITLTEEAMAEALDATLAHAGVGVGRFHLAPTSESLIRFFLACRHLLEKRDITLPVVSHTLYTRLSDKEAFGELCLAAGLTIPRFLHDPSNADLPFVAKPKTYDLAMPMAPLLIMTEQERVALLCHPNLERFYLQEYINGRSIYLLFHFAQDGSVQLCSQENLVQQPNGKSIIAAITANVHYSEKCKPYIDMLKSTGFHGLIMIEIRIKSDDTWCVIEANPRLWGPSQFVIDIAEGHNLFDAFLDDCGFDSPSVTPPPTGLSRYFWFGGLMQTLSSGKQPAFHNYSVDQMLEDIPLWLAADVYRRPDTFNIFIEELMLKGNI